MFPKSFILPCNLPFQSVYLVAQRKKKVCLRYPWLHYDATNDSAFCHVCLKADKESKFLSSTKRDPAFVCKGYTYWKDANSAFQKHQQSHCHREANEVVIILPKVSSDVVELLSHKHHEEKEKNKKMFLKVLEGIRCLARQGLPF